MGRDPQTPLYIGRFDDTARHPDHDGLRARHLDGWTCRECEARDAAYDKAIAYARAEGAIHGANAASWVDIDETNAQVLYDGIVDIDPAILDRLPSPDLSGEWADTLTGPQLIDDALNAAGVESDDPVTGDASRERLDWFNDVCDAYELAFTSAVEDVILRRAVEYGAVEHER